MKVQALLMPLFPGIDDRQDKIEEIIEIFYNAGVRMIKAAYIVIRDCEKEKDREIIKKIISHPHLKLTWGLMTEALKVHIGEGKIYPFHERIMLYKNINKICKKYKLFFSACAVLDPVLKDMNNNEFDICNNVWTSYKKII
ncbi:MAG: hypothetical protein HY738_00880 [Bacteroidia bacterium]|nr:hypothetical protein [Bacteroidia bacterium]